MLEFGEFLNLKKFKIKNIKYYQNPKEFREYSQQVCDMATVYSLQSPVSISSTQTQ